MPALGFAAVPLLTKNRSTLPGCQVAAALGDATAEPTGSLVLTVAAAFAERDTPPNSRRAAANATHASGAAAGLPSVPSPPSHIRASSPRPLTRPGAADITGGASSGSISTASANTGDAAFSYSASIEMPTASSGSAWVAKLVRGDTSTLSASSPASSTTPATAELGRAGCGFLTPPVPEALSSESPPPTDVGESPSDAGFTAPGARLPVSVDARPSAESETAGLPRSARAAPRDGLVADDADDVSADPVEPAEPVVSASATGIDAAADPMPKATANAPTRPTYAA